MYITQLKYSYKNYIQYISYMVLLKYFILESITPTKKKNETNFLMVM